MGSNKRIQPEKLKVSKVSQTTVLLINNYGHFSTYKKNVLTLNYDYYNNI